MHNPNRHEDFHRTGYQGIRREAPRIKGCFAGLGTEGQEKRMELLRGYKKRPSIALIM